MKDYCACHDKDLAEITKELRLKCMCTNDIQKCCGLPARPEAE